MTAWRPRAATHATALERMRAALADPGHDLALRALARHGTDDPAIGLLDTWAYVADVVAFYSERIAQEGYLKTATQRGSVRELARALGYELRPGVAAQVDLAFFVQGGPGTPESVLVPAGTPAQSVPRVAPIGGPPGPAALPQTFETSGDLEVRAGWNVLPAVDGVAQTFGYGRDHVWLRGVSTTVRVGDSLLVVGSERASGDAEGLELWDFRVVTAVQPGYDDHPGWVRLVLDRPIGYRRDRTLVAEHDVVVHAFATRARLFGWSAPDPNLLVTEGHIPAGAGKDENGTGYHWDDYDVTTTALEVDGEHPEVLPGSWVVLQQFGHTEAYLAEKVTPDGAQRYALSGPITRLELDVETNVTYFDRRRATVRCGSSPLPATEEPAWADDTGSSRPGAGSCSAVPTPPPASPRSNRPSWTPAPPTARR
jgi:hypothetical protein